MAGKTRKKVTSTDIARAAGVSQATVSMVLNKKYNVSFSRETVEKVENAAKDLGYILPKRRSAKNSKNSRLIVVFCPTLTNPYYVMLLQGIETVAKEKGYGVFTCNTQRELKIEEQYLRMMPSVAPAGIIYTCNPSYAFMEQVEELAEKIPLVIISNRERVKVDAINQDNTKVGSLMARHLLDLGHRKVAFIAPPLTKRQQQRSRRVEGFVKEYEKEGLTDSVIIKAADDIWDEVLPSIDSEYRIGYNLTRELLSERRDVTAIAGLNDMIAFGIIDALQEENQELATSVFAKDHLLDEINANASGLLADYIQKHPETALSCIDLASVFRKLERAGDHITNIAEEIVFFIDAKVLKHRNTAEEGYGPENTNKTKNI